MNKENINLANNIFQLSSKFDNLANEQKNINDMIEIIKKVDSNLNKITSQKLKKICQQIYDLHVKELELIQKNIKSKNTLLLFIKSNCPQSLKFLKTDWEILKNYNKTGNKIRMVVVECDDTPYYKKVCETFNITEYPSIRYVTYTPNQQIHEYYGTLTANSIQEEYNI